MKHEVLPNKSARDSWRTGYVYLLVNKLNRRIYVGHTKRGLGTRWNEYWVQSERIHWGRGHSNQQVVYEMAKFGIDAFDMILLAYGWAEAERYWISKLNATDPKIGYNSRPY